MVIMGPLLLVHLQTLQRITPYPISVYLYTKGAHRYLLLRVAGFLLVSVKLQFSDSNHALGAFTFDELIS